MIQSITRNLLLTLTISIHLTSFAPADVLYDNFAFGDTYFIDSGWAIGGRSDVEQAQSFTISGGNFLLTSIDAAVSNASGTNSVSLIVYAETTTGFRVKHWNSASKATWVR